MREEIFNLKELGSKVMIMDLLHHFWMILLVGLSVWLGTTGISEFVYVPQYTASATMVVGVKGSSNVYSSLSVASQMASVFGEVLGSSALQNLILEDVGEEMKVTVSCEQIAETNLLAVRAAADNPRDAYTYLQSALKNYDEVSGQVFSNAYLQVVQEPSVPSTPSNSSWFVQNRPILTLAGMLMMAGTIVLFYLFRFTVKRADLASGQLDGTILGVIPYEKKGTNIKNKKKKESLLITSPLVSMNYAEAGRKLGTRLEHELKRKKKQILLVTSISENEGKSTVAANIALAMAERHKKVLLVDGDLRKPAQYKVFEKKSSDRCFENVLNGTMDWQNAMVKNKKTRLHMMFQFKNITNPSEFMKPEVLAELAEQWRREMDYIIIDVSPTSVSTEAEQWMQIADSTVFVVRQDWSDVRMINDNVDLIWQTCGDFSGFVLNAFLPEEEWGVI